MIGKIVAAVAVNSALIGGLVLVPAMAHGHGPAKSANSHAVSAVSSNSDGYGYGYGNSRPGWGYGDKNHDHSGPPGLLLNQSEPSGNATSTAAESEASSD